MGYKLNDIQVPVMPIGGNEKKEGLFVHLVHTSSGVFQDNIH